MFLFDFFSCHNAEVLILIDNLKFKIKIITIFDFTWDKTLCPEPGAFWAIDQNKICQSFIQHRRILHAAQPISTISQNA